MATARSTIDFLVEQGSSRGPIVAKAMFGEYALYFGNKLVALVCDDQLFVKPTEAGRRHIGTVVEAPPYPGARASFLVGLDLAESADWLSDLFHATAEDLPEPVPRKPRNASRSREKRPR